MPTTKVSMDWDKLRIFHAVAEAGSFTHAGEQLNLSQSAVSRQIAALEESLTAALEAARRPSQHTGPDVSATTREFVDAVLGLLRSARRDTEFALGVGP